MELKEIAPAAPGSAGALSLMRDCVKGTTGETLLIVVEPAGLGYYDTEAQNSAALMALSMGMTVRQIEAPPHVASAHEDYEFMQSIAGYDHVVFFSRIGDQLRFSDLSSAPSSTMCYTLDREMLDSAFGSACHQGLCEVKALVDQAFDVCEHVHVTCPRGTDYSGSPRRSATPPVDATLKRFPMLVPRPVPAEGFSGRVALGEFIVGTGSHYYNPFSLFLEKDVFVVVEDNQAIRFEGDPGEAARLSEHYEDIAGRYGVDPWFVHSWHAGIHPGCGFPAPARSQIMRWSGSAFGNPRLLHFHTCGAYAPGEISWNIIDPTITLDGVAVWENGRLHPERLPGGSEIMAKHPHLTEHFRAPRIDIGVDR
jgi:hypothetical protein